MPSQPEAETTFTLSFGGVDFCLTPSAAAHHDAAAAAGSDSDDSDGVVSVSKVCRGEVRLRLANFTGTLRVVAHPPPVTAVATHPPVVAAAPVTDRKAARREVEEGATQVEDASFGGAASDAAAPTPVEDTPSPQAKCGGDDDGPGKPEPKPKQRRGQQRLNFFGKKGKQQKKSEVRLRYLPCRLCCCSPVRRGMLRLG